jgi:hypothetical protein
MKWIRQAKISNIQSFESFESFSEVVHIRGGNHFMLSSTLMD